MPLATDRHPTVVTCDEISVRYSTTVAVDHLSFRALRGEVVALLGPNGAGKTSTVEALEGYRRTAGGSARVLGLDPVADHRELVPHIGVMLQRGGVYPSLGPARVLRLFAGYYDDPADPGELVELVGLADVQRTPWRRLSGGEQQRLSLALALVGKPSVVFLDEPTAGVDPEGRLVVRRIISDLRDRGVGVILTTHELTEAEHLADRVVIVGHGRKLAEGTPAELTAHTAEGTIRFSTDPGLDTVSLADAVGEGATVVEETTGGYRLRPPTGTESPAAVAALAGWLATRGLAVDDLRTGSSLEEAYLAITATGDAGTPPVTFGGPPDDGTEIPATAPRVGGRRSVWAPLLAQLRAELSMILSNGETLFLTLGIPVLFLLFFSAVHVLPTGTPHPVDFLVPGILALAVMSTAMTALGIGTGFERGYGVLKRLGTTPLGRPRLLGAKIVSVLGVELIQAAVLVVAGLALGWSPGRGGGAAVGGAIAAMVLGTVAFGGIGLVLAGALKPLVNLAVVNTLFVVLLLLGGMLIPLTKLPGWLADAARVLPASALADALHASLGLGVAVSTRDWVTLAIWAVAAPAAAARFFRWE